MNPELRDIEARLRELTPRTPDARLRDRLEQSLADASHQAEPVSPYPGSGRSVAEVVRLPRLWRRLMPIAAALGIGIGIAVVAHYTIRDPAARAGEPVVVERRPANTATAGTEPKRADRDGRLQAVHAENVLKNRLDEGLVLIGEGLPARRYRYQFVDTVTWRDPADGSEVTLSVPREEVVLVPLHTF